MLKKLNKTKSTKETKRYHNKVQPLLLRNYKYLQARRDPGIVYDFLNEHIVREYDPLDTLDLYNNYYRQGKLAVSIPQRDMAKIFGYADTRIIRSFVSVLQAEGSIQVENVGPGKGRSVYVLGTHDKTGETLFLETVYGLDS